MSVKSYKMESRSWPVTDEMITISNNIDREMREFEMKIRREERIAMMSDDGRFVIMKKNKE